MTQTQPPSVDQALADLTQQIANLGSQGGRGIGLAKNQKPIGVIQNPLTGGGHPGMSYVPGPETMFGTELQAKPYQPGDEQAPGGGDQTQMRLIQEELVMAGLLNPMDVRGIWDAKAADAYKVVLAFANQRGMNASDALNVLVNNPRPQASAYRYPMAMTNPADSAAAIDNQAGQMIGGGLPTSEASAFASYQTAQDEAARQRYISSKTDKQSAYVGAPSPTASAREYLLAHNQQDIVNYDLALRTMQFSQALKEL